MYVRNAWYVAAWTEDVELAKPLGITILGELIVLWRADGRVIAMEDRCIHRFAPLSLGRCEGSTLRCMYHGMLFNTDGNVVRIPGQQVIPPDAKVRTFPTVEKHSWIWVWMGDPALADVTLVPPAIGHDDPNYILGHGWLDYKAEARLINDNLLDFSHFSFVHEHSLQVGQEFSELVPKVRALPRGVHFTRWGSASASFNTAAAPETWIDYEYNVPGIMFNRSGTFPAGTGASCDYDSPDPSLALHLSCSSQAVTPTGRKTSRYFFSHGVHRSSSVGPTTQQMMAVIARAFEEDRIMIEAQQRVIDSAPDRLVMPTAHDRGTTMFNRKVARLVDEEQGTSNQSSEHDT